MGTMGMDMDKGGNQLTVDTDTRTATESSELGPKEKLRELADDLVFRLWGEAMGLDEDGSKLDPVEFAEAAIHFLLNDLLTEDESDPTNQGMLLAFRYGILVGRGAYGTEDGDHA